MITRTLDKYRLNDNLKTQSGSNLFEERLESLYIINCVLHEQDEALYRLDYTNLRNENIQFPYTIIELAI